MTYTEGTIKNIFHKIKLVGMYLSGSAIFIMMAYICVDVVLRNIFGATYLRSYEISENYFMTLAVFPALPYVFSTGIMPRIEVGVSRLKIQSQRMLAILVFIVEIILFSLLTIYSFNYAMTGLIESTAFSAGGMNFPLAPILFVIPISLGAVTIETIYLLTRNIKGKKPYFKTTK